MRVNSCSFPVLLGPHTSGLLGVSFFLPRFFPLPPYPYFSLLPSLQSRLSSSPLPNFLSLSRSFLFFFLSPLSSSPLPPFPSPPLLSCSSLSLPPPPRPIPSGPAPPRLRRPGGAERAACPGGAERAPSGEHSVPERPRPPTCAPARSARANNGHIVAAGGGSRRGPCSWPGRKKARGPRRGARPGHSAHLSPGPTRCP